MRSLFVQSAVLTLAALCHFGTPSSTHLQIHHDVKTGGGTVIVEGDHLISQSDNPGDEITAIHLVDNRGKITLLNGCGEALCSTPIPHTLSCGNYTAKVFSADGGFEELVYICIR